MRLGIDARALQHETQYRGIGKSLASFLIALKDQLPAEDSIRFYIDKGLPKPGVLDIFPDSEIEALATARLGRKRYFRSFMPSFKPLNPRRGSVDAVLQYDASLGVPKNVPSAVVFHDLIPYLFRGQEKQRPVKGLRKGKDALARNLYWKKYLAMLADYQNASRLIAISRSSKKDLIKHLPGIKPERVVVIPAGLILLKSDGKISPKVKQLAKSPYFIYVGGVDIRKNIMALLETFIELKNDYPDLKLVLVGKEFELHDRLEDLGWFGLLAQHPGYDKDIILPGFVTDAELAELYKNARALLFASRYEGFGLPILEAMAAGCPVIAYNNSSIPEVAGDAALMVPDGESLLPAARRILDNAALRKELAAKGKKQAANFSWNQTAQSTVVLLHKIAKS